MKILGPESVVIAACNHRRLSCGRPTARSRFVASNGIKLWILGLLTMREGWRQED
ncbi:hypothetical protein PVAP13_5NG632037 [Panicum virgatum]|uniref:Uncharacterized protein n=1 Tax=Panicum virgatum TaxID=38727 RepID=A0A8T0S4D8_PANVG|nr:hypothetical protein PVAP13_5NG632037 [Panicum virgatum]